MASLLCSSLLAGIVGAAACTQRPKAACDLHKGIEVDDAARTITIHLSRSDPEFLYRLAWGEAAIVPSGTRLHPTEDEIPGTGPYRVAAFDPRGAVRLVRNPHFRVWSEDARPDGYADEIRIRPTDDVAASIKRVEQGRADVVALNFRGLTPAQLRGVFARNPATLHTDLQPATIWLFLNTRVAPFTDVRVRRAINFAVDRRRYVQLSGNVNTVTCQILPPDLPGFRPYCPYTQAPNAAGTWAAPDLAKARALVAASGSRGSRIRVAVADAPPPRAIGRYVVELLARLGYRSTLVVVPPPKYTAYVLDTRHNVQSGLVGWFADRLIPSNFLEPIMSCASFIPNSTRNANAFGYCNPAVDARIREAAGLEVSDPVRADELWAKIDQSLTDQALAVPLGNTRGAVLVSERVGNYVNHPLAGPLLDQLWVR